MASYDESRLEYQNKMGKEWGLVYHLLWNQCAQLHFRWTYYCELFGNSQTEIDVMNQAAPGLFETIHDVLWESILLDIAKFCDPPKIAGKKPLSLEFLATLIPNGQVAELKNRLFELKLKTAFARDWRHRHIAHWDYAHSADSDKNPLATASRFAVKEALAAIVNVLEAIDVHFTGSSLYFDGDENEPRHLIRELKLIQRLREDRMQRLLDGNATPDDMDWAKWH
jgi:hypothetical protein